LGKVFQHVAKKASSKTETVTRIAASDDKPSKAKKSAKAPAKTAKVKVVKQKRQTRVGTLLAPVTGYFKGAWFELRQVHWPSRSATWGLTGAVLAFSAFFVVFILLLDAGYKYVFELILK